METHPSRRVRVDLFVLGGPCPLCDDALAVVRVVAAAHERDVEVRVTPVEDDPALFALHGLRVPVLAVEGREVAHGRFVRADLEREIARVLVHTRP